MAREVLISLEEWDQMQAMEESNDSDGEEKADGAVEYEYEYDEDPDNLDGVPDEMSGEYKN